MKTSYSVNKKKKMQDLQRNECQINQTNKKTQPTNTRLPMTVIDNGSFNYGPSELPASFCRAELNKNNMEISCEYLKVRSRSKDIIYRFIQKAKARRL